MTNPDAIDPQVTLIGACAHSGVIGRDNRLPWRLPEDLKLFKATTMGQVDHSIEWLRRSLAHTPYPIEETILEWVSACSRAAATRRSDTCSGSHRGPSTASRGTCSPSWAGPSARIVFIGSLSGPAVNQHRRRLVARTDDDFIDVDVRRRLATRGTGGVDE